jgi:diaminopimelate epimerase
MTNKAVAIEFTKMHGIGNDFVVINATKQSLDWQKEFITQLSDRHFGIGFDQLLIIEPSQQADFFCRIYNADGSEAEQCGNGLRCVARFIHEEGLHKQNDFTIATIAGVFPIHINDYDHIRVTLSIPKQTEKTLELALPNNLGNITVNVLSLGNPHAIVKSPALESTSIHEIATAISSHAYFPNGVNVGFMQIQNPHHVRLRTIERGSGETNACGSNACAAALSGIQQKLLSSPVTVEFCHGALSIEWDEAKELLTMTGPATRVFSGTILLP